MIIYFRRVVDTASGFNSTEWIAYRYTFPKGFEIEGLKPIYLFFHWTGNVSSMVKISLFYPISGHSNIKAATIFSPITVSDHLHFGSSPADKYCTDKGSVSL